ncbi:MAG: diguanylate cyclase [bacterium]|nr:diguanylate cyclase [bacterium]
MLLKMDKNHTLHPVSENLKIIYQSFHSSRGKFFFLAFSSLALVFIRVNLQAFNISLRYLYMLLINLAAFWFGLRGGLIMAFVSITIFFVEINVFHLYQYRDLVVEGALVRVLAYFSGGLIIGYLSGKEKKLKDQLNLIAYNDELTGCSNYRFIMEYLEKILEQSKRNKKEMNIVMMDLDYFKAVNDNCGHMIGNEYLKWFSGVLRKSIRTMDMLGRYGGDEFLLILPDCDHRQASSVLSRIRKNLANKDMMPEHLKREKCMQLKFSAGVASFPYNGKTISELVSAADNALYQAKKKGRNRVVVERRKAVRLEHLPRLKMEIQDKTLKQLNTFMHINDISRSGMSFFSPKDIEKHDFSCQMHYPEWEEPMQLACRIVRREQKEKNLFRFGVHFIKKPEQFDTSFIHLMEE